MWNGLNGVMEIVGKLLLDYLTDSKEMLENVMEIKVFACLLTAAFTWNHFHAVLSGSLGKKVNSFIFIQF